MNAISFGNFCLESLSHSKGDEESERSKKKLRVSRNHYFDQNRVINDNGPH